MNDNNKSFAEKYSSKSIGNTYSKNTLSKIIEKKEKNMTNMIAQDINQGSSIAPEKAGKSDLIYLVKGVDDGRNAWYYVLVERLKLSLFLKALNDDIIHLENYGEILYSAYGDEPTSDITEKLKKDYGIK